MTVLAAAVKRAHCNDGLFWEDLAVGQVMTFGHCLVSREDIIGFARQYDPQPSHIDEQAARTTMLKGLAASGWHICTVFMTMLHDGLLSHCRVARLHAIEEIKWRTPVRPGDQLSCQVSVLAKTSGSARPGFGACTLDCAALNAGGRVVMSWKLQLDFMYREIRSDGATEFESDHRTSTVVRRPGDHGIKYFEDVRQGDEIKLGDHEFTADRIADFGKRYCRQPVHPDAAVERPSASGWHVTAVWMQRLVRYYMRETVKLQAAGHSVPQLGPSLGIKQLRWHRPVYEGDVLTFASLAERKLLTTSKPGWGLLIARTIIHNQDNEDVASFFVTLFLERRSKA